MNDSLPRPTTRRFYLPELDGLRFVAFLGIFLHHGLPRDSERWASWVGESLGGWISATILAGSFGVDVFFCLSAFLITELLLREREVWGRVDVGRFLVRRGLRIWPLYLSWLILILLILPALGTGPAVELRTAVAFFLFFGNWECVLYGFPSATIAPLWSVAVEEQFYLSYPWFARIATPRRLLGLAVGLVATSVLARLAFAHWGLAHPAVWCATITRMDPIAMGILISLLSRRFPESTSGPLLSASLLMGSALAVVASARSWPMDSAFPSKHLAWSYLLGAAASGLVLIVALRGPLALRRILSCRAAVYLGRVSFGLYIFHFACLLIVNRWLALALPPARDSDFLLTGLRVALRLGLGLGLTTALAALSYRFLESPFLRLKSRFSRIPSQPIGGLGE